MANASKSAAPASPAPQAQTPIILPPNDSDKDTNHYVLNAVGYVNVPIAGNEGIISAPPTASGGAGVGGFVQTDQRATFQSRAGGRFRRPAASADVSAEKKNGATAMASEPAQAAEGALASAAPISSRAKKSPVVTVDHLGTRSLDESLKVKQAASKDTATSDTATSPSVTVRGVALIDLDNGFIPQAQSAAGSTIGVPQIAVLSARSPANAKSPTTNAVIGDSPAIGALFGSAQEALKQPAQALAQNEYKKSTQEGQPTDINGILVLPDPALPNVNNFGVGVEGAVVLPSAAAGTTANGAIGVQGGTAPPSDAALPKGPVVALIPQPEVQTLSNAFSTFSLNVSDVAFKLAAASLENGVMPDISSMRSEEFVNAFDYRDPEPAPGAPIGFAWERAGDPFAHNRDFLRFSVKTAAEGRDAGRPLNLVLLLDKSGSMERADRVEIVRQALTVLAGQLQARDTLSVVIFARTAHLWVDGAPGNQAGDIAKNLSNITPEGGTDLEEAMKLAYATALRHYLGNGENRVVLLTDGAANLGEVDPDVFKPWVESNRKQGIALDCFGVGWDGYNDTTLESLSRAGGGRYGFINTPEDAATDFAGQLAGALRVAASDVKVQVEFNPNRVISYRQVGYAKHQLTKEQFRDNTVAAAQIGAAESGNALYTVEINPAGDGPVCTVRVRYHDPGTSDYREHAWEVPYTGTATPLDRATPAIRLAACAGAFSELLAGSPFAGEVTFDKLLVYLNGIPAVYGADTRPQKLEWMVRQAKSISGK
jgi:Mg-chelatase subunit ChlD